MFDDNFMAIKFSVTTGMALLAFFFFTCYNSTKGGSEMTDAIQTVIITVIITEVVNLAVYFIKRFVEKKDAMKQISEKVEKLNDVIITELEKHSGVKAGERSISGQLGVGNGASLAVRVDNIKESIDTVNKEVVSYISANSDKLKKLSKRQKEIRDKISDISDVIEDWERLLEENDLLRSENQRLNNELTRLNEMVDNEDWEE